MPMLTMSVMVPSARTRSAKSSIACSVACTSRRPSVTSAGAPGPEAPRAAAGSRSSQCMTARCSVWLMASPANIASRQPSSPQVARQLQQQGFRARVDAVLGQIGEDVGRFLAETAEALRIGRKRLTHIEGAAGGLVVRLQCGPGGGAVAAHAGGNGHRHGGHPRHAASTICSSLAASAAKARMPSASFSVAMASALSA